MSSLSDEHATRPSSGHKEQKRNNLRFKFIIADVVCLLNARLNIMYAHEELEDCLEIDVAVEVDVAVDEAELVGAGQG